MKKKVTLFLMGKKGLESLKSIIEYWGAGIIDRVYTATDIETVKDYCIEIVGECNKNKISVVSRMTDLEIKTDLVIAISWRWLIKTKKKLIVLHDSLFPRYKGWSPLVTSLINGENEIGVTAFIANGKADDGEVIMKQSAYITYPIKIMEAIHRTIPLYCQLCNNIIDIYREGKEFDTTEAKGIQLPDSFSMWRDEDDYNIDWGDSAYNIMNFINAVGFPYKGAVSYIKGMRVRIFDSELYPDVMIHNREKHTGKVFLINNSKYVIVTVDGLLKLNNVVQEMGNIELKTNKLRVRFR